MLLWSMQSDLPCSVKKKKKQQLQAYYGILGGAPGTLGRSILILGIAVSLKHSGILGKVGCTVREMDGAASKEKLLEREEGIHLMQFKVQQHFRCKWKDNFVL